MKTVCFISHSPPNQLGGVSIYYKNLLNYLKNKKLKITWAYFGKENKTYTSKKINYIEIKKSIFQVKGFENNFKTRKFLKNNYFDTVFTTGGPWIWFYLKPINQKLMQIFHGTVYYFNKNHLKRFSTIKKVCFYPLLSLSKLFEYPHYDLDKIVCVSNKVKKQVEKLYGESKIKVIRTGVDLKEFKPRIKKDTNKKRVLGLYVGGGGYYTKGLDRAINISREIYKLNPNYRLLVIGPDKTKVSKLINEKFVIFLKDIPRDQMKYHYNAADVFFCMSRYEGGAPTLVVSEAMASRCLVVCSKDSKQEIIKEKVNGLIISKFNKHDAEKVLDNLKNKKIIRNSLKTIKNISLENWGEEYLKLINM